MQTWGLCAAWYSLGMTEVLDVPKTVIGANPPSLPAE